jgi:antitoxin HigA-1
MSTMYNPPHPGEVLRDGVFADKGLTVTEFAKRLGVTRVALSRVLNGKAAISADMAVRLAAALGAGRCAPRWRRSCGSTTSWRKRDRQLTADERAWTILSRRVGVR